MSYGAISLVWLRCGFNDRIRQVTAILTKHHQMPTLKRPSPLPYGHSLLIQQAMLAVDDS